MSRPTHVILELALAKLLADGRNDPYLCNKLQDLANAGVITSKEQYATTEIVQISINYEQTLGAFLRTIKPEECRGMYAGSEQYWPHATAHYNALIAELRAQDKLWLIVEAGYHCAHSFTEMHREVIRAGLPETSDETLQMVMGQYTEYMQEK